MRELKFNAGIQNAGVQNAGKLNAGMKFKISKPNA
jgi:hypothetical protein